MAELKRSDSVSEVSESGTSACTFSSRREELHEFAIKLGFQEIDELYQERFKVNRRKLEHLILGEGDMEMKADDFFEKIMSETNTKVVWPSRIKIGSKSHKDPHIRIVGRNEDVKVAKNKIMAILNAKTNRVTMKLDVSYTDHSHIIGKGGQIIKKVMEETGCHIHFPDSNRNNPLEKSNQVSIAGEIKNVEDARAQIRELSPLLFTFELPVLETIPTAPDICTPYIMSIQEKYNVQVKLRTRSRLYSTSVVVKGCEWELSQVEEATFLLVEHMCGNLASQSHNHIQMIMEISPQHHPIVRGKDDLNLRRIMQSTGTQIVFPDVENPCIPSLKKSTVTITGTIHNVYLARQLLMGSLPLVLIFEVADEIYIDADQINMLMQDLDLSIMVRQKPRYNLISIIIKGIERKASNIYEAYRQLRGLSITKVIANIPLTYTVPSIPKLFKDGPDSSTSKLSPSETRNNITVPLDFMGWPINQRDTLSAIQNPHILQLPHDGHLGYMSHSLPDIPSATHTNHSSKNSSPQLSPNSVKNMHTGSDSRISSHGINDFNMDNSWRAPGFGRTPAEYHQMKLNAIQALHNKPSPNDLRVPMSTFAGYGFSSSTPPCASVFEKNLQYSEEDDGARNLYQDIEQQPTSNFLEAIFPPVSAFSSMQVNDIMSLLALLDLEKYIPNFRTHEIDLAAFRTLSESDLREIGIHALGARRKLLAAITEFNRIQSNFLNTMDRKSSSSTHSLNENW